MQLQDLANDILLDTVVYLEPTDIFSLRKTCRRLHAFTLQREVWTIIYTNCPLFLPSGPLFTQTVLSLERIILRAYRLNALWVNSANKHSGKPKFVRLVSRHALSSKIRDVDFVRIYRSRYIVIGGVSGFLVYDLLAKCEVYRYSTELDERLFCLEIFGTEVVDNDENEPFVWFGKKRKGTESLVICKLNPLGHASMFETANISSLISLGSEFFVLHNGIENSLLHFSSGKVYPLVSTAPPSFATRAIIFSQYVLCSYTVDPLRVMHSGTYFELFPLPDPGTMDSHTSLHPTHSSLFEQYIREPTFISFDALDISRPPSLWLLVNLDSGLHPLQITLFPDATMKFHLPNTTPPMIPGAPPNGAIFTVGPGSRAIGAARVGYNKGLVALYSVSPDLDKNLRIDRTFIKVPQLYEMHRYMFDPFVGIVAATEDGEIHVIDLV